MGREHDEFGYDKAGNRTRWVTTEHPETGGEATTSAAYDGGGQLTERNVATPGLLGLFPKVTTTSYACDGNGNRVSEKTGARTTAYTWTAENKLASVKDAGRTVSYGYDGLGRALTEASRSLLSSDHTSTVFDGLIPVGQNSTLGGERSLVRDVTGDVAIQNTVRPGLLGTGLLGGDDTRWGLTDRLGSTIGQAQGSRISQVVSYDVWGVPTFATAGVDSTAGFSGEVQDAGAGLVGFHARAYEPVTGSWLSADPYRGELGSPQTLGRYQYVGNNPATSRDLLGYMFQMSDWGTAPPGWKPGHLAPKRTTPPSRVWNDPPKVFSPWSAYKPTVRHENWDGDATCDAYDRRGTCIAHLTPQQRDQAQDIGAVIGGILIGAAITGGIIAAAGCTVATAGVCGAVILGAGALGGAATGAAICDWKSGPHTTEQCLGEGLAAAPTGALGGAIGIAASKAPALIAASTKAATAVPLTSREIGSTMEQVLDNAALIKQSNSTQYKKPGGFEQANSDFDALTQGVDVVDRGGGLRTATLSNGTEVNVRPYSSGDQITVEIQTPGNPRLKIRYAP